MLDLPLRQVVLDPRQEQGGSSTLRGRPAGEAPGINVLGHFASWLPLAASLMTAVVGVV